MSATHTNPDWYESNRPPGDPDPQWHHDIVERINISVPEYMFHRVPTASDAESGSDFAEDFFEIDPDLELDAPSEPFRPGAAREVPVPEVFVNHARLWGLAVSPGGGVTAALASYHPAHGIERGGFQRFKIRVMFDFVPPADRYTARKDEPVVPTATEDTQGNPVDGRVCARPISTEARVWEWMYGGGAGVAGVSAAAVRHPTEDDVARAGVRELFVGAREATQKCPYCKTGLRMTADGDIQCAGTVAQHAFGEYTRASRRSLARGSTQNRGAPADSGGQMPAAPAAWPFSSRSSRARAASAARRRSCWRSCASTSPRTRHVGSRSTSSATCVAAAEASLSTRRAGGSPWIALRVWLERNLFLSTEVSVDCLHD